jgi:hypothetical protein
MTNRQYVIFDVTEIDKIDFTEVLETAPETLVRSVDGTKTFVKWEDAAPASVLTLTTNGEYLTTEQIVQLMTTADWSTPMLLMSEPVVR